jgi:hypothetical protein
LITVILGYLIYAAMAAAVIFGLPVIAMKLDRSIGYWEGVRVILGTIGVVLSLLLLIWGLVALGMFAGDLVSGRVSL